jgi:two-component system sensor histidine kinase KdpD
VGSEKPDSDELLARIQEQRAKSRRGRLKVFFGAAAGVGKTYAMLEAAQARRAEGVDVVAGYVAAWASRDGSVADQIGSSPNPAR